ncbi:MAG: efflux RND transporter periplasmic adaptor subunit [Acidobacteriota bacterium]|nr:efflux RND transporter periplasmic adaptor subunit [Acidobacteriota bacterium]
MRRIEALAVLAAGSLVLLTPVACGKKTSEPGKASDSSAAPTKAEKKVAYWYDPMKPEVHFDHPGKSPFMDMQLVAKYAEEAAAPAAAPAERKILYWYDPMHPQYRSDRPAKSPDCGMDMVPKYAEPEPVSPAGGVVPAGLSVVRIPLERRQQIGVTTAKVARRPIGAAFETNGAVAGDEGRVYSVNAKFSGYIEKLLVDRTGQPVRRGQPLLTVYSPELVATQQELLLAVENARRLRGASSPGASSDAGSLLAATRQRLRFWDISEAQIRQIETRGEISKILTLYSPASGIVLKKDAVAGMAITPGMPLYSIADLSTVWVLADVYQSELASTSTGNKAEISASFLTGENFAGRVDFVYPTLSEETRTVKVRIVVPNPRGLLKPGMFVRVSLQGKRRDSLTVPRSAVLPTGERQVAFVEQSPGVYAPREVKTGATAGDFVEVLSGLADGEVVVTSANFLIDSESRIGGLGAPPAGSAGQPSQSIVKKPGGSQ